MHLSRRQRRRSRTRPELQYVVLLENMGGGRCYWGALGGGNHGHGRLSPVGLRHSHLGNTGTICLLFQPHHSCTLWATEQPNGQAGGRAACSHRAFLCHQKENQTVSRTRRLEQDWSFHGLKLHRSVLFWAWLTGSFASGYALT